MRRNNIWNRYRARKAATLTSICTTLWWCVVSVECEVSVSRDREIVNGEGVQHLRRFDLGRNGLCGANLGKAVGHIKDEDNKETISGALDLEVAEEGVGTEEVECFINNIGRVGVSCSRKIKIYYTDARCREAYLTVLDRESWS